MFKLVSLQITLYVKSGVFKQLSNISEYGIALKKTRLKAIKRHVSRYMYAYLIW